MRCCCADSPLNGNRTISGHAYSVLHLTGYTRFEFFQAPEARLIFLRPGDRREILAHRLVAPESAYVEAALRSIEELSILVHYHDNEFRSLATHSLPSGCMSSRLELKPPDRDAPRIRIIVMTLDHRMKDHVPEIVIPFPEVLLGLFAVNLNNQNSLQRIIVKMVTKPLHTCMKKVF